MIQPHHDHLYALERARARIQPLERLLADTATYHDTYQRRTGMALTATQHQCLQLAWRCLAMALHDMRAVAMASQHDTSDNNDPQGATMRVTSQAPAVWLGWQPTLPDLPPLGLWTLTEPLIGHPADSPVCTETLEAAGYHVVEPSPQPASVPAHPTNPGPHGVVLRRHPALGVSGEET